LLMQCRNRVQLPVTEIKMSEVLTDIHFAEAAVDNESASIKDSVTRLYYPQIYAHHGIKQWEFDSSMSIMSTNPVLMERIFKKVQNDISKRYTPDSLNKKSEVKL
jgi:Domain of unknown function (DUF4296)